VVGTVEFKEETSMYWRGEGAYSWVLSWLLGGGWTPASCQELRYALKRPRAEVKLGTALELRGSCSTTQGIRGRDTQVYCSLFSAEIATPV
jgi:hypothetical protein